MKRNILPFNSLGVLCNNTFEDVKNVKSFTFHIKVFLFNQKVEEKPQVSPFLQRQYVFWCLILKKS